MFVKEGPIGTFTPISEEDPIVVGGTTWPGQIVNTWLTEELSAISIYRVNKFQTPLGYKATGSPRYTRVGDVVNEEYDVVPGMDVPQSVSRRQLLMAMYNYNFITGEEAVAAAQTGAVPEMLQDVFDALPSDQRIAAMITWASMSEVLRQDPILLAIMQVKNISPEQMDNYFRSAAYL